MKVSRRSTLRWLGTSGTAAALGLFPELSVRGTNTEDQDEDGFEAVTRNLRARRMDGRELSVEFTRAQRDEHAGMLWRDLGSRGLQPALDLAYGSRVHITVDRTLAGHFMAVPFTDAGSRRAKLYYGSDAMGKRVAFATEWDAGAPGIVGVRDVNAGRARQRSTVRISAETAEIDFTDGGHKSVDLRPIHQGRRGVASVSAGPCTLNGLWCELACGTVLEWSCLYETSVVCGGLALLCPPCAVVCEIVSIVVCTVAALTSCHFVCEPCS